MVQKNKRENSRQFAVPDKYAYLYLSPLVITFLCHLFSLSTFLSPPLFYIFRLLPLLLVSLFYSLSCVLSFFFSLRLSGFTMKQLIRRLSRVSDSSQYCLLRRSEPRTVGGRGGRAESFRAAAVSKLRRAGSSPVPQGHVPVYVGDEMERFVVSAELLNHPVFVSLLDRSAQEYGYEQQGVLRIHCHVLLFERVLEALRLGNLDSGDLQDLIGSFSDDFLS